MTSAARTSETVAGNGREKDAGEVLEAVSVEHLGEILRAAGYRVTTAEHNGSMQLMSASQGIGFAVRPGNRGVEEGQFLDYTLSCALQVQGELPAQIVAEWNRTRRFARLWLQAPFLVLELDVVVAGGVTPRHLRATIELWDRMIQEFLLHLRNPSSSLPATADAPASEVAAESDESKAVPQ